MNRLFTPVLLAVSCLAGATAAGAADYYYRKNTTAVQLSSSGGVLTTVQSANVPAGRWIVQGKTSLVNFGAADFARCVILVAGTNVNGAGTMIGQAGGMPAVATVSNLAVVKTTATQNFSVACFHDADGSGLYVDPDGAMVVTRAPGT